MTTRIGFSTPKRFNPVSWLVRKVTGSPCSHAFFIYFDKEWQADFVMEAHEMGFRIVPLAHFEKKNEIVASFIPRWEIDTGMRWVALEYLGRPYDFGGLFGMAVVLFGRWLKRKWKNPLESAKAMFCSEAVVVAMQKSAYPKTEVLDAHSTAPRALLEFFTKEASSAVP